MVKFFKDGLEEIIGDGLDLVFCNEDEAMMMYDADNIESCTTSLRQHARQFAITRGAKGAILFDGNKIIEVPAKAITPIDSNGAGDIYAGAFLYGLSQGMTFERCGELADAAAGTLIQKFGARLTQPLTVCRAAVLARSSRSSRQFAYRWRDELTTIPANPHHRHRLRWPFFAIP